MASSRAKRRNLVLNATKWDAFSASMIQQKHTKIPNRNISLPNFQSPENIMCTQFIENLGLTPFGPKTQPSPPVFFQWVYPKNGSSNCEKTAGYVTFGQPSSNRSSSYDAHFSRPGFSALGHDLAPHRSGSSVWLEIETVDLLDTRVSWRKSVPVMPLLRKV